MSATHQSRCHDLDKLVMTYFILAGNALIVGVLVFSWLIARRAASRADSSGRLHHRNIRLCARVACQILLTAVAVVPLGFLDLIVIGAPFQTLTYSGLQSAGNLQVAEQDGCSGLSGVELELTIQSLSTAQAAAEVDMALCVGDQVLRNLSVNGTGVRPLANGLAPSAANAGFLRSSFRVSYYGTTPQTYMTRSVTVGSILGQTDPTGEIRNPVDLGVVTVPLYGNVINYPFDSYSAAGAWQVFPPAGTAISNEQGIQFSWTPSVVVAATPDSDNLAWRASSPQAANYAIEASRISFVKCFVCLIAGLPLLLFVGLLALVWPLANNPERRRFPAELLVGVGAFLLAIIPVRTVLVPAEISQITMTDYLLGAEMAVMVAGSLIIVLAGQANPSTNAVALPGEDAMHNNGQTPTGTPQLLPQHAQTGAEGIAGRGLWDTAKRRNELIRKVLPGIAGAAAFVSILQHLNRARKLESRRWHRDG